MTIPQILLTLMLKFSDECTATRRVDKVVPLVIVDYIGPPPNRDTPGRISGGTSGGTSSRRSSQPKPHPLQRQLNVEADKDDWVVLSRHSAPYPYYITENHSMFLVTERKEKSWCVNITDIRIKNFREHLRDDLQHIVDKLFFCPLILNVSKVVNGELQSLAVINYDFPKVFDVIDHYGMIRRIFGYGMNEKHFTVSVQTLTPPGLKTLIGSSIIINKKFNAIQLHQLNSYTVDFKFMNDFVDEFQKSKVLSSIKLMHSILDYPVVVNLAEGDRRVLMKVDYRSTSGGTHFTSLKPSVQLKITACHEFKARTRETQITMEAHFYFKQLPDPYPYYTPKEHGTHDKFVFEIRERLAKSDSCTTVALQGVHSKLFVSLDEKLDDVKYELFFCPLLQHGAAKGGANTLASFNVGDPYGFSVFDLVSRLSIDMHGFYGNNRDEHLDLLDECADQFTSESLQKQFSKLVTLPHPVDKAVGLWYLGKDPRKIHVVCTTGVDLQTFCDMKDKVKVICKERTTVKCDYCNPTCSFERRQRKISLC